MSLNQQSSGPAWDARKAPMRSASPIVDCGVHYVDVMCETTDAWPAACTAGGLSLSDEVAPGMYEYGQLRVAFANRSLGWYDAQVTPASARTAAGLQVAANTADAVAAGDQGVQLAQPWDRRRRAPCPLAGRCASNQWGARGA